MAPSETPLDLLPYQNTILAECLNPTNSDLIIIARGLGLRRLVCSLLRIYDNSGSLVLLINCDPDEDTAIGEQLGVMGARHPGLRIVDYEMGSKARTELYNRGGLVCVTSRILVVDMLKKDIPTEKVTGIVVMHAEKYGTEGFIKAFSDQPEQFTYGMSPLKTIMKELHLRKVHIYPRFHEEVNKSLERRRADVVEIFPSMTPAMEEIHISLVQCMTATLQEIKRTNSTLDLEDINVESAYFRHFDAIVRRALAPVWHRVRPATKQLVNDLGTLRSLLVSLLSYDCVALHAYLETIVASNSEANTGGKGQKRANQSPWLYTDAANVLLTSARRRCYVNIASEHQQRLRDEAAMDEEFALLDELEGRGTGSRKKVDDKRPAWLPHTMEPVLEELPKWKLLADVLKEIDESIIANSMNHSPGTNTTLVMLSDNRSATLVREYLAYARASTNTSVSSSEPNPISEAMRKKDTARAEAASRRRRVRGAGTTGAAAGRSGVKKEEDSAIAGQGIIAAEADEVAEFLATQQGLGATGSMLSNAQALETLLAAERSQLREGEEDEYGLLEDEHTVLVRTYGDDGDDQLLSEIRPRYIVMMEPNLDFIRRRGDTIELYLEGPILTLISKTVEEHKFLAGQRREKDAFEALIKEKGSMVLTIEDPRQGYDPNDSVIRTISSRIAGGAEECTRPGQQLYIWSSIYAMRDDDGILQATSTADRFEENKSFTLQAFQDTRVSARKKDRAGPNTPEIDDWDIQSKLVLLTLAFPKLRIIWSSSPYATGHIYRVQKEQQRTRSTSSSRNGANEGRRERGGEPTGRRYAARSSRGYSEELPEHHESGGKLREFCELSLKQMQEIMGDEPAQVTHM
ncbi:ERCC4 domain [Rhizoctonia solani]|uniref:ERCC4 domain n=1 Tax=Rhizoctonia solani TaxID=456999 RepID=A0A8H7ICP2_9AGAM|nr:ERCC4 domain [Rhizoctonia solani]